MRHLGSGVKMDSGKVRKMLREKLKPEVYKMYGSFVTKLISYSKGYGVGVLRDANNESLYEIIDHHGMMLDDEKADIEMACFLTLEYYYKSIEQAEKEKILDFDDQLFLPVWFNLRLWQNDVLIIDEAQDVSPIRLALAQKALRPEGRCIAFGDPNQSIYGFTGAMPGAMDHIKRIFNSIELPLSICYRCSKSVVEYAQSIVPQIEATDNAIQGEVWSESKEKVFDFKTLTQDDAILCRKKAPLVKMAFHLLARRIPCKIKGKDIGKSIISLIEQMRAFTIEELETNLENYRQKMVKKLKEKEEDQKAEDLDDQVDCIFNLIDNLPGSSPTVQDLINSIESLFEENAPVVTLSTCHKSKGLEFGTVCILMPEAMPSRWARKDWEVQQEQNLMYVSYTRAKNQLVFLNSDIERK
jgi:superfamily I DNA/RNA helicase